MNEKQAAVARWRTVQWILISIFTDMCRVDNSHSTESHCFLHRAVLSTDRVPFRDGPSNRSIRILVIRIRFLLRYSRSRCVCHEPRPAVNRQTTDPAPVIQNSSSHTLIWLIQTLRERDKFFYWSCRNSTIAIMRDWAKRRWNSSQPIVMLVDCCNKQTYCLLGGNRLALWRVLEPSWYLFI